MLDKNLVIKILMKRSVIDWNTGCFIWVGGTTSMNYGTVTIEGIHYYIHRLSAYVFKDLDFNSKFQVNHVRHCKRHNCWAPAHIYVGTQEQNMKDRVASGNHNNAKKKFCAQGHEFNYENTYFSSRGRGCRVCNKKASREYRERKLHV